MNNQIELVRALARMSSSLILIHIEYHLVALYFHVSCIRIIFFFECDRDTMLFMMTDKIYLFRGDYSRGGRDRSRERERERPNHYGGGKCRHCVSLQCV